MIELRDGAKVLGKATADDSGQFVIIPDPLPQGEHTLQLASQDRTGAEITSKVAPVKVEAAVAETRPKPLPAAKPPSPPAVAVAAPAPVPSPAPIVRPSVVAKASPTGSLPATPEPSPSVSPTATTLALAAAPAASPAPSPNPAPSMTTSAPAPAAAPSPTPTQALLAAPAQAPAPAPAPAQTQAVAAAPLAAPAPSLVAPPPPSGASGDLKIVKAKPNDAGGLEATGDAAPGERVRLTLNGAFIAEVVANALGRWSLTVERGLTAGLYALRAQAVEPSGATGASTDATFAYAPRPGAAPAAEPAAPAIVAAAPASETPSGMANTTVATVAGEAIKPIAPSTPIVVANADPSHAVVAELRTATVIKGDNLWDLARHFYGDGLRYSDIFHANSGLIHNPNLIYIGQVFVVPQDAQKTR